MVDFSVFNELSIPFEKEADTQEKFIEFFKIIKSLNAQNLHKIRMTEDFKNYEILKDITFQEFFGGIKNITFKDRLREFIANRILKIETPLIKDDEIEDNEDKIENEYLYNGSLTFGGLACADIWNTIAVSFNSSKEWDRDSVDLKKDSNTLAIRHVSKTEHLDKHRSFFDDIEREYKLEITQDNLWEKREYFFPTKIVFCKEIEKQIKSLDKTIFQQAISILRDVETDKKEIYDFKHSGESKSIKNNNALKKLRYFTIDDEKIYFDNHIKSLPNANRMYFLKKNAKIYIGYIGTHLPTAKH